jgi:hypothetical protein
MNELIEAITFIVYNILKERAMTAEEQYINSTICQLFKIADISQVSKRALMNALINQYHKSQYLAVELASIAPNHEFFKDFTTEQLAQLKEVHDKVGK